MKSVICTDTHLGVYNDSDVWLEIVLDFYKHIVKYCIENKINRLFHLGDFFDNRKSLNTKTQHYAHRIAKILSVAKDLHVYIIVGNHDCYYKNQIHPNTLELFNKYSNISIIDEITKVDDILMVPWGSVPNGTQGTDYCFGHFAFNGFHMNDSYKCKKGLDVAKFNDFKKVLSGHFHTPSSNANVTYLGSPYGQTFHDAGGTRGYYTFEDGSLEFIEYNDAPKFMKIPAENDFNEDIEGNIVKIIFSKDYGTNKNQDIIDEVLKFKPLLYSVDFTRIKESEDDSVEEEILMDSKERIIDQYIDSQVFPTNINVNRLKSMFKKIMKETGEHDKTIRVAEGSKIECLSVGFQNFLSFGSQWQEIPLNKGINFVTGFDKDKGKSNGAGKSSFLETIPFALFGKTAREIKQDQIINWKNKKNCSVVFKFKINDTVYEISRSLKPNKLEVYKNGSLIDQDAHKNDYQDMFENIFGMDVKMFMSLVHSNLNDSANILNMKKADKRKFLERMFGLEIYSNMNKTCNDKLRDVEQKKYKIVTENNSYNENINSSLGIKKQFLEEINSKKSSIEDVNEIKEQLDKMKEDYPSIDDDIEKIKKEIDEKKRLRYELDVDAKKAYLEIDSKINALEEKINNIESLEKQIKENKKVQEKIDKISEKTGDIDEIKSTIDSLEEKVNEIKKLFDDSNKSAMEVYKEIAELKGELKSSQDGLDLISEGKCPTCGQDVKDPIKHYQKDISSIKRKITVREKKYEKYNEDASNYQEEISENSNKIKILHKTKDTLNELKNSIKTVSIEEDKDDLIKEKNNAIKAKKDKKDKFELERAKYSNEEAALGNKWNDLVQEKSKIADKQKQYDMALYQEKEIKKHISSLKSMINEQEEKIKKFNSDIEKNTQLHNKLNTIMDYLNSIKVILKDENIKQFTIKQIMPFMNKKANEYLSEVNYGFYIVIDKWLDIEIKGPGIRNASYGSLSGGERRGIDISIQLALLDIAQVQAGLFPDILIFDELLDSSIDGVGINQLMSIIKYKQKELNNKTFVITHRNEVDSELIDTEYKVVKSNGYSKVHV